MSRPNSPSAELANGLMTAGNGTSPKVEQPNPHRPTRKADTTPIAEALKIALTGTDNTKKSPVSLLYELLSRRGITPQYELLPGAEGAGHESPPFRFRVSYQDGDAIGTGNSKKEAKHAAASVLIDKLTADTAGGTKTVRKTPITVLQEVLVRRGITPQYELLPVEEPVKEPTFRYRVSYQDKDATGSGKSKKEAKQAAAKTLIDKLAGNGFWDIHSSGLNFEPETKQDKPELQNIVQAGPTMSASEKSDLPASSATSPDDSEGHDRRSKRYRKTLQELFGSSPQSKRKTKEVQDLAE